MADQEAARRLSRIAALAAVLLALCLAACETANEQSANTAGTGAAAAPPHVTAPAPPPPDTGAGGASAGSSSGRGRLGGAAPAFAGGSVRKRTVTAVRPLPPSGYGLYVYILPERLVPQDELAALQRFHACLGGVRTGEAAEAVALLLLPVKAGTPTEIDLALSHDLVRTSYAAAKIDPKTIYVVMTKAALRPGTAATNFTPIALPEMSPEFLTTWLVRLQTNIEQGQISAPRMLDLRIRNVLAAIGAAGELVGIKPAQAAEPAC